jgi:methionine synthase II (cobalamin-independent)
MDEIQAAVEALNKAVLKFQKCDTEIRLHGWGEKSGTFSYLRPQGELKATFHGRAL